MKRFIIFLILTLGACAESLSWDPVVPMERQIFPSYLIAISNMDFNKDDGFPHKTEGSGFIGFRVRRVPAGTRFRYSVEIPGFVKQTYEEKAYQDSEVHWLLRPLPWDYEALRKVRQPQVVSGKFRLQINDEPAEERLVTISVRPVNEVLIGHEWREPPGPWTYRNTAICFAAFVNEDHPWIDTLLKECLQRKLVPSFDGYQSGDRAQVLEQIFAIWNSLQRRGIRYSSVTASSASREHVRTQNVRLLDDSIQMAQSNCVDGSVLWASILRRIGLRCYLVLIPGHCFLAVDVGTQGKPDIIGIETTMMGDVDLKAAGPKSLEVSRKSFLAAIKSGTATLQQNNKFLSPTMSTDTVKNPDYQYIDIAEARRRHVMPIVSDPHR